MSSAAVEIGPAVVLPGAPSLLSALQVPCLSGDDTGSEWSCTAVAAPSSFGHISIAESVGRASLSSEVSCAADDALDMGLLLQETDEWVSAVERAAPVNWQDCFLDVSRLAGLALACSPQKGSSSEQGTQPGKRTEVVQQQFFHELEQALYRISFNLCRSATSLVEAFKAPAFLRLFRVGSDRKFQRGTSLNIFLQAQWCTYCAAVNHAALFILLLAYGKISGGHDGRLFQERCLRVGSVAGAFMMSPVMTEVKAVFQKLQLQHPTKFWPYTIQTAFFTSCTEMRSNAVKSACVQSFQELHEDLECKCPICLEVMYNPVGLPCGHSFCAGCLFSATGLANVFAPMMEIYLELLTIDKSKSCPTCRQSISCGRPMQMKRLDSLIQARHPQQWRRAHAEWKKRDSTLFKNLHDQDVRAGVVEWSFIP